MVGLVVLTGGLADVTGGLALLSGLIAPAIPKVSTGPSVPALNP